MKSAPRPNVSSAKREADIPAVVRHYWRVAGVRPWHLLIPVVLALVASAFEGGSLALLLPLKDAIAGNSFAFLQDSRYFGWILRLVPESARSGSSLDAWLVFMVVALLIVGRVFRLAFDYLGRRYSVARNERYRVLIGQETFGRVLRFGRKYFDRHALGRLDTEIGWSSSVLALLAAAEGVLRQALGLLVKVGVMFAISLPLAVSFLIIIPAVQRVVASINRAVRRHAKEGAEMDRRIRAQLLDVLGSIPLVKAYSQEAAAADTYAGVLRGAETIAVRRDRVTGIRYPLEEVSILSVMLLVQLGVIWFSGGFQPADLAAFAAFLFILQQGLKDYKLLSGFVVTVFEELPRLEAVAGLFSDEGKFIVPSGPERFPGLARAIEVRDLRFGYTEGASTLDGVTAAIPAGKVTAIVGASGSGKSTLVGLIARLYDCPPGAILVDGVDLRRYSLPSLHARMTLVSQEVWLLHRTLRENLTFGLGREASDQELEEVLRSMGLEGLLARLERGLDTEVGDRGVRLSGGQRQRIALARALLREPEILILDEATSALDSVAERDVALTIERRLEGRTVILIAHRLSTVRDADQILVMENGKVVEQGTWPELVALGGAFTRLHLAQFERGASDAQDAVEAR